MFFMVHSLIYSRMKTVKSKVLTPSQLVLDYPGVGPEHAHLKDTGRVTYTSVTDEEALDAFQLLAKTEGIIPALESSHAVAYAMKLAKEMNEN